jgi:chorismate mutase/prephenate dehydratase
MSDELKGLRDALDEVDRKLVGALAERQRIVQEVAALKLARPVALRDHDREEALLTRLTEVAQEEGADPHLVTRVYQEILTYSVRWQRQQLVEQDNPSTPLIRVAIQGRRGSYSDQAARRHFAAASADVVYDSHDSFRSMLEAVRDGRATYGVLPIENTTAGSISEAYDLLAGMELHIVGEEVQPVEHCLIGLPGARTEGLLSVWSHPQALLQCSRFLGTLPGCVPRSWTDTAGSCERILQEGDPTQGAIASEVAAEMLGLQVLQRNIANQRQNFTRMVVVAAEPVSYDARIPCKTSLVFGTAHQHGALLRALRCFEDHQLSLSQLQSRPRPGAPFEYLFYVDFEGNVAAAEVQAALDELRQHTSYLRVMGCYPAVTGAAGKPAQPRRTTAEPAPRRRQRVAVGDRVVGGKQAVWMLSGPLDEVAERHGGRGDLVLIGAVDEAAAARERTGWPVGAVLRSPEQASTLATQVDLVVVRSRDMADDAVLDAVGRLHVPVLLQRDPTATTAEWLAAADRVRAGGNQQVILGEGGVQRDLGLSTTPRIDLATLVQLGEAHPVVVITSSEQVARAAIAAGADGAWLRRR